MKSYELSNANARFLDEIASATKFKNAPAVLRFLIEKYGSRLIPLLDIDLELEPAMDGAYCTQKNWIVKYNAQKGKFKGRRMISSADVIGAAERAPENSFESLQNDCSEEWIVTSTHVSYNSNDLSGKVVHNYKSKVVSPKVITLDNIPVLEGLSVDKVVQTQLGLSYIGALADNPEAGPADLLDMIVKLSGKEPAEIVFWTPNETTRKSHPERAVRFDGKAPLFRINGINHYANSIGHTYGVLIS